MHADNVHEGLLRGHPQLKVQVRGFLFVDNNIVSKSSTLKLLMLGLVSSILSSLAIPSRLSLSYVAATCVAVAVDAQKRVVMMVISFMML